MFSGFKRVFYFPIAWYFRFFAEIRLRRWKPRIVVLTGSNGKTTLLHLLESQLGKQVKFSHHANSSFGIPFDILGLHRSSLLKSEWLRLFLITPLLAFQAPPKEKIYVVEADCDRPGEGKFLAELLRPEVVLWVSVAHTHTVYFDERVNKEQEANLRPKLRPMGGKKQTLMSSGFATVDEAVAFEFGWFLEYCQKLAIVNGDLPLEVEQVSRTKAKTIAIKQATELKNYEITKSSTVFTLKDTVINFPALLPKEVFYGLAMCLEAVAYLGFTPDLTFSKFVLPPGRNSLFAGIKGTTIVDSCYNANLASMEAILGMFALYPAEKKWLVIGDMLEQGRDEQIEHEKLAEVLAGMDVERILLLGPRVGKYTYPSLRDHEVARQSRGGIQDVRVVEAFLNPKEVLDYLEEHISGGEAILFKGARFMEGVIAHLLKDKKDEAKLSRREKIWDIRRKQSAL